MIVAVAVAVRVALAPEVGDSPPFCTVTETDAEPNVDPLLLNAFAEIV